MLRVLLCLHVLASSCYAHSALAHGKIALTDCGNVSGTWDPKFKSFAFRGIPYAMPPIGERRWKRSELLSVGGGCWKGTLDTRMRTDEYMDTQCCAQNPAMHGKGVTWDGIEDCLTLDVRSPMEESTTLRPVLVMIHGGSLMSGVPDIPYAFRDEGFVLVGVRYRLNVLGFLALSELTDHDTSGVSGNYGFSDQVTALEWVQRNAKAFGGDPDKVTIMGCSSGGSSVWNLLAIPSARGLFARAVPMSAASRNNMTLQQAQEQNVPFVDTVCGRGSRDTYNCLKEANLEQLMKGFINLSSSVGFDHPFDFELPSPSEYQSGVDIVDGVVVQKDLHVALSSPDLHTHVPVLSGSCSQEGDTEWLSSNATAREFKSVVRGFVQNLTSVKWPADAVNEILRLYPPTSDEFFGTPKAAMDAMIADIRVVCGTIYNAERLIHGRSTNTSAEATDLWLYYSDMRATGGYEMTHCMTLDALSHADCSKCNPDHKRFHKLMLEVHSEFVKNGRPPAGTLHRFSDTSHHKQDYIINSITWNISSPRRGLIDRCMFWRSTNILEGYAWDELGAAIHANLVI